MQKAVSWNLKNTRFVKQEHDSGYYWVEERTELMLLPPEPYTFKHHRAAKVSAD